MLYPGAAALNPALERFEIPYQGIMMAAWLHKPRNVSRPAVAVILPGLDACKERNCTHGRLLLSIGEWPPSHLMGRVRARPRFSCRRPTSGMSYLVRSSIYWRSARRGRISRQELLGKALGPSMPPSQQRESHAFRACIANCGPYDFGKILPSMPPASQEVFVFAAMRKRSRTTPIS